MRRHLDPARKSPIAPSIVGAWTIYAMLVALRTSTIACDHKLAVIERQVGTAVVGAALTIVLHLALRRLNHRTIGVQVAGGLILSALPAIALAIFNFNVMFAFYPAELWPPSFRANLNVGFVTAQTTLENYFIFTGWAMFATALSAVRREEEARRGIVEATLEAREAQLRALRFQLDPHFLFNTLNTVSALVMQGDADGAERAIEALSDFLRATLTIDASTSVTLEDELRLQQLYLSIEQIRFSSRLRVAVSIADDVRMGQVPSLLLQPIVENVVRHAVTRVSTPVSVRIDAYEHGGKLVVSVENDAVAVSNSHGEGIGLANVAARLDLLFGAEASLRHGPAGNGGYRAEISMPMLALA